MKQAVTQYLASLEFEATTHQADQIATYAQLLWDANSRVNLTRHTDEEAFLVRDLRDSVLLSAHLEEGDHVLDIGSGGGVPGILLAILRPDVSVSLAESIGKKADALSQFVSTLEIPVAVYNDRAENVVSQCHFDVLTVRAVGSITKLCTLLKGHWHEFTRMLALKGPNWPQEVEEARRELSRRRVSVECLERYDMHATETQAAILELRRR